MSMNFKFSRGYGECRVVPSVGVCCYSNTNPAELLPQQQRPYGVLRDMSDDTGGL